MGFFDGLRRAAEGLGHDELQDTQHICVRCNVPMGYRGAHAIRTGGLSKGAGLITDFIFGGRDEEFINTAMERNVAVHVFVCEQCGQIEFVNDPQHGF